MKQDIHPEYTLATVHCACGNTFQTRSTVEDIHVEICSVCHPFFTGQQRIVDTAGRVERFNRKWKKTQAKQKEAADRESAKAEAAEAAEASAEEATEAAEEPAEAERDTATSEA